MANQQHIIAEQQMLLGWVNGVLRRRNDQINALTDLKDGVKLVEMLETLEGRSIGRYCKNPTRLPQKMDNLSIAFSFIQNKDKFAPRFDVSAFANGNIQQILAVLYCAKKLYPEKVIQEKPSPPPPSVSPSASSIPQYSSMSDFPIKRKAIPDQIPVLEPIPLPIKKEEKILEKNEEKIVQKIDEKKVEKAQEKKIVLEEKKERPQEVKIVLEEKKTQETKEISPETLQHAKANNEEYAKFSLGSLRCGKCNIVIEGGYIEAIDKFFHPDCFVCEKCNSASLVGEFFFKNQRYVCRNCMDRCAVCNEPVTGQFYTGEGGKVFHHHCIKNDTCDRCKAEIKPTVRKISALNRHWHEECFVCHGCSNKLAMQFMVSNGSLYCSAQCRDK